LPAVWWYGAIPVSDFSRGSQLPDRSPILVVGHVYPGPDCRDSELRDALQGGSRVLLYLGFRFDDVPLGFDRLLLRSIGEIGSLMTIREFAGVGRAAVIDLRPPGDRAMHGAARRRDDPPGCLTAREAQRW
jgi:hypothetical protein